MRLEGGILSIGKSFKETKIRNVTLSCLTHFHLSDSRSTVTSMIIGIDKGSSNEDDSVMVIMMVVLMVARLWWLLAFHVVMVLVRLWW